MNSKRMIQYIFKLWLALYRLENAIWERYSYSFVGLNSGKEFHEYHQSQQNSNDIPF